MFADPQAPVEAPQPADAPNSGEPQATPTTTPPEPESTEPAWPEEAVTRAREVYGIANPEMLGSPEQLQSFLAMADARMAEIGQRVMGAQTAPANQQPPATPSQPQAIPQPAPQPQGPPDATFKEFELGLTDEQREELGTDLVTELANMTHHYNTNLAGFAREVQNVRHNLTEISRDLAIQWLDSEIHKLGPEWEPLVGSGPSIDLAQDSDAMTVRREIEATAVGLLNSEIAMSGGQPRRIRSSDIRLAANAVAAKRNFNPKAKQLADAVEKRARGAIARPTESKTPEAQEESKAAQVRAVQEFQARRRRG